MNQILYIPNKSMKYKWFLYLELTVSLLVIFSFFLYIPYFFYKERKKSDDLNSLLQYYSISQLYAPVSIAYEENKSTIPFIICTLDIPSLSLSLPVLSEINDDLLDVSVCRFYGPMPNQSGNLCIAGHNYNDGSFFSNIPKLSVGDIIFLTDLSNLSITYEIFQKYEISAKDISCTNQNTNGQKEITLVTCNNLTGNRVIIKAKEK